MYYKFKKRYHRKRLKVYYTISKNKKNKKKKIIIILTLALKVIDEFLKKNIHE